MSNCFKFPGLLLLALALAIPALAAPPSDSKSIQGTWVPIKAELGGQPMGNDVLTNIVLKVHHGTYQVTVSGVIDKGTYSLDPEAKPKKMDIKGKEGPNANQTIRCIYELHGDTLKVCYGLGDSPRPTEFKTWAGTQYFLVTYARTKS